MSCSTGFADTCATGMTERYQKLLLLARASSDQASGTESGPGGGDGTSHTSAAASRAIAIARSTGASLELYDVVCEPALAPYRGMEAVHDPVRDRIVAERSGRLGRLAERLRVDGVRVEATAQWGERVDRSVARRVLERDVDLVITDSMHRSGESAEQDWRVVAMCPVPVLVARQPPTCAYRRVIAAVDPLHAHAKPGALDQAILRHAHAMSQLFGASLQVVHCYVPLTALGMGADAGLAESDAQDAFEASVRSAMQSVLDEAGIQDLEASVLAGRPESVLNRLASEDHATLIVMGALSRSGLKRLLIGSTAERFLRRSSTDVLLVNPPGMSFAES